MPGLTRRLGRLIDRRSGRTVLLPIDQPVTMGPLPGIVQVDAALEVLLAGHPNGIIAHRGVARRLPDAMLDDTAVIVHLSAGTSLSRSPSTKVLTGSVWDALALAADAVSVQVTFGTDAEPDMLRDLAATARCCETVGMPLLAMVYVDGVNPVQRPETIAHAARVVAEMGSDLVKVPWTGDESSFEAVVHGCFAPVVVAGGNYDSDWSQVTSAARAAVRAGAIGTCVGRNVFQHLDPAAALGELRQIVHGAPDHDHSSIETVA